MAILFHVGQQRNCRKAIRWNPRLTCGKQKKIFKSFVSYGIKPHVLPARQDAKQVKACFLIDNFIVAHTSALQAGCHKSVYFQQVAG